jgi:cytidylate kinase
MSRAAPVLAIDGPGGSGKGTIARRVATALGWHLLDSGALYRLVALAGQLQSLAADDVEGHAEVAASLQVSFGVQADGSEQILLGTPHLDVTAAIRTEEAGLGASRVAAWPAVRAALFQRQRDFARLPGLVADGRDMGTVVFPDAPLKIYLTASVEERARRRYNQLKDKDSGVSLPGLLRDMAERDSRDMSRAVAPLVAAQDAIVIDSTPLGINEVVAQVIDLVHLRRLHST